MTTKINTSEQNAACAAIVSRLDLGAGAGRTEIRSAPRPATIGSASSGVLLATCVFGDPAFGAPASGVATANAITSDTNASASGDAAYARCYADGAADNAASIEMAAGEAGDGAQLTFDDKTIVAQGIVNISSFTFTVPAS